MPTQIQVMNRYVPGDPVVGAAITFDHTTKTRKHRAPPPTALSLLALRA